MTARSTWETALARLSLVLLAWWVVGGFVVLAWGRDRWVGRTDLSFRDNVRIAWETLREEWSGVPHAG